MMWPLLHLDPVAQGLRWGPTLWLKRLPSGPAEPEPEGRGWVVSFATVSYFPQLRVVQLAASQERKRPESSAPLGNFGYARSGSGGQSQVQAGEAELFVEPMEPPGNEDRKLLCLDSVSLAVRQFLEHRLHPEGNFRAESAFVGLAKLLVKTR